MNTKEQARLQVLNGVLEQRLSVAEAVEVLVLSERHVWRILAAYRKEGAAALSHGNRGRRPANAITEEMKQRLMAVVQERYLEINHTHLTELLTEREGITLSRSTVRRLLVGAGLPRSRHRRGPRHRCRRQRMPQEGMLLQIDGSHHAWLEARAPVFTLLMAVDDATGTVPYACFRDQEDTQGYLLLMQGIIQRKGIPLALYNDRCSVFGRHPQNPETECGRPAWDKRRTQFGRALKELGVQAIFARSPQAKGRVERMAGTFQDRLVSELRLAGANSMEEANRVLWDYLPRFNQRFGVQAAEPGPAYREAPEDMDIDGVLCIKDLRRVAKDNTVPYRGRTLQLFPDAERTTYAGARVEVQERLDGSLVVYCQGKVLTPAEASPLAAELRKRVQDCPALPVDPWPPDEIRNKRSPESEPKATRRWKGEWYRDEETKRAHRGLIVAGMERARLQGTHIGRPRVTEREGFRQRFEAVVARIGPEGISRRQAAQELAIGYATLKRLLDARSLSVDDKAGERPVPASADSHASCHAYAEVLH